MSLKKFSNLIQSWGDWEKLLSVKTDLDGKVIKNLDFTDKNINWSLLKVKGSTFLGCSFLKEDAIHLIASGALVYPKFKHLPYNPNRVSLYTWQELMKVREGFDLTVDEEIYHHFMKTKYTPSMEEAMAQRIHDYSIDTALRDIIDYDDSGMTKKRIVGFMGGHTTRRGSEYYVKVALAARGLSVRGYYIATGGGPGIMEAANLGAYFGAYTEDELMDAVSILSDLNYESDAQFDYLVSNYFEQSIKVLKKYPHGKENFAIPTWFYGHEPSNLFASHIAKYFSNSIREDILLSICLYGIVYAPGSAGTTQEIFQEATQNHYGTFGYYSPMVFLGKKRYTEDTALYSVLHQLARGRRYKDLLFLTDSPDLVVDFIENHPPVSVDNE